MSFPVLTFDGKNLTCQRGDRLLFSGVDFELKNGELLLLTGPNGSGKSSLLRMIAGLLAAKAGEVSLKVGDEAFDVAPACHYLAHSTPLKSALSVSDNLAFWQNFSGEDGLTIEQALNAVELLHLSALPASVLSAGQARRVAFARLLVSARPIWLLDEPTAAMDKRADQVIGKLVKDHLEVGGIAIAATHLPLLIESSTVRITELDLNQFVPQNPFVHFEEQSEAQL